VSRTELSALCPSAKQGQLIYAANGRLSVQIVRTGRAKLLAASAGRLHFVFRPLENWFLPRAA